MSEKNVEVAVSYYKAMNDKNLSGLEKHLHPEVQLFTPLATHKGKENVVNAVSQFMNLFVKLSIRAQFGAGDQAMVVYDVECPKPIGVMPAAALMHFKDGRIVRIELFLDPRPSMK